MILLAWLAYPLALTAISLGLGLGVAALTGRRIPRLMLIPVGYMALIVASSVIAAAPPIARFGWLICIVLAVVGGYFGRAGLRGRIDPWPLVAAIGAFLVYGATALAMGGDSFAGFIKLDDHSTWMAMADQLVTAGRTVQGLPPSTYEALLQIDWDKYHYPIGIFPPLGYGGQITGVDLLYLLQPYIAWTAGVLALGLAGILSRTGRAWRSIGAFIAAQAALLLGYALWGGIKETGLAVAFVVLAWSAARTTDEKLTLPQLLRWFLPLAVASAAVINISGFNGGAWLVLPALWAAVMWWRIAGWKYGLGLLAAVTGAAILLGLPTLMGTSLYQLQWSTMMATTQDDIGNLWGQLSPLQVLGIWPTGDFRARPGGFTMVLVLLAVLLALACLGAVRSWRTRDWVPLAYVVTTVPLAILAAQGGAWVGGKALAMASPAVLTLAVVGAASIRSEPWVWPLRTAYALVAVGVLWSTVLAYQEAWMSPTTELEELRTVGARDDLPKPSLMLDYSVYGSRHLLRRLDNEGASELRRNVIPTTRGTGLDRAEYAEIDSFPITTLRAYPTLVLRRSPLASRPPAEYTLAWQGTDYEVWVRDESGPRVRQHYALSGGSHPARPVQCDTVKRLAAEAQPGDLIAYVERPPQIRSTLTGDLPAGWTEPYPDIFVPTTAGTAEFTVDIPRDGQYLPWISGGFRGRMTVSVDGEEIFRDQGRQTWPGHGVALPQMDLSAGEHTITVRYDKPWWLPGRAAPPLQFSAPYFSPTDLSVETLDPKQADSLCGKRLDWLELVAPASG